MCENLNDKILFCYMNTLPWRRIVGLCGGAYRGLRGRIGLEYRCAPRLCFFNTEQQFLFRKTGYPVAWTAQSKCYVYI